ncbi:hypothetical protein [Streptomyces sp. CAU 1734]|uniref:hypothetical protein n=1 Tax=Streptomyces sp. CAU 1734 TaxID=3140360 RepID=UPI003261D403
MKRFTGLIPIFLLLGITACTSGDASDSTAKAQATCKKLLGPAGVDWLDGRTGGDGGLHMGSDNDLKSARSLFYGSVKQWDFTSTEIPNFGLHEVCRVRLDVKDPAKQLDIQFNPSIFPFDTDFTENSVTRVAPQVTSISRNVRLVHGEDRSGKTRYRVYVKCKIPGSPARQANDIPIEGQLTDTLTGETSPRVLFTHLLHSAKVVAEEFGCTNKPAIPDTPPASVTG